MKYFVTSDTHFGHANIIKYCARPFRDVNQMDVRIIKNWNERVKPEDTVFHLGDFQFKNSAGGNQNEGQVLASKDFYWKQLNGRIYHISGNHDGNNAMKSIITHMVVEFGGLHICLVHDPAEFMESVYPARGGEIDVVFCGHVHQNWKHIWRGMSLQYLIINVGVDVWKFMPMEIGEILGYYTKVVREQVTYQQRTEHNARMAANYNKGVEQNV